MPFYTFAMKCLSAGLFSPFGVKASKGGTTSQLHQCILPMEKFERAKSCNFVANSFRRDNIKYENTAMSQPQLAYCVNLLVIPIAFLLLVHLNYLRNRLLLL